MTVQIIEFHGDEKRYVDALLKAQQRTQELEAELKKAGKASQDAAGAVGDAFKQTEQEQARVMNALRAQLRAIGPEGSAAAKAMSESMAKNGETSEVAVNELLEKIKLINPVAAEAARAGFQTAKDEMAEASRFGEGAFQKPLDKLRAMGPEGRKAAELLKASLVEAGKISERSMADVVDELRKIDPAAAEAAQKIQGELEGAATESESAFDSLAQSASGSLLGIATGFLGIQQIVSQLNEQLERKKRLLKEAEEAQMGVAKSQASAALNFASFDPATQKSLLDTVPGEIASKLKFDNVSVINDALANVASSGETDKGKIIQAVETAVRISRHKVEDIPAFAKAISDVSKKSGLTAEEAASTLITAQGSFAGANFGDLATALPQVIGVVKSVTAPGSGTSVQDVTRQAGALLSAATIAATDETGLSSTTFATSFSVQLNEFFTTMDRQRIEARSKIELIDRKIAKGKQTEKDVDDKKKLESFLKASTDFTDPMDFFARVGQLQGNEGLRESFIDKASVETRFKMPLKQILTAGSDVDKALKDAYQSIQPDVSTFKSIADTIEGGTSQLRTATSSQAFDSPTKLKQIADRDAAMQSQILEQWTVANDQLWTGGATQWLETSVAKLGSTMSGTGPLRGDSAAENITDFVLDLATRQYYDQKQAGGLFGKPAETLGKRTKYTQAQIQAALDALESLQGDVLPGTGEAALNMLKERGANDPIIQQQLETFSRLEAILAKIASHTEATAANTLPGDQPSTTPQLSSAP